MANFQDLADMTPVLKNVYLPVRKKAFKDSTPFLAAAKKGGPDRVKYSGNDLFFAIKLGRRGGFVASANGYLPDSTDAREKQGRLGIARTYFTVEVDGLNAKASADSKGSFISASKKLVEDVMDQWPVEQNRILHGDSLGIRALVLTKSSDTVLTVASPYGLASAGPGNLHINPGDTLALLDATDSFATVLGKAKVISVSLSGDTATITFDADIDGAGTAAAGDALVAAVPTGTSATDSSYAAEPYGWKAIVDVENAFATFQGINDANWVAQKATSSTVDETVVQQMLNFIRNRAGIDYRSDPKSMLLVTTTGIWTQYGESMLGLRRFSAPEMVIEGGFTAVKVCGAALLDDPWCPRGRMYFIHTPDTVFIDLLDFGKLSFQDSPQWKQASKRDAYEAVYAAYWNYGVFNRMSHGVISGITDTTNYSPVFA